MSLAISTSAIPHDLAYMIWDDTLWVLAIAHNARRPEYWITRRPGTD